MFVGCSVRAAFHPAAFESSLARHKEEAAAAAQVLAADIRDGRYDPARPDFNQGQLDPGAEAAGEGQRRLPGRLCLPTQTAVLRCMCVLLAVYASGLAVAAVELAADVASSAVFLNRLCNLLSMYVAAAEDGSAPVAPPPGPEGPVALWRPERVAADYRAAKRLVALLDHQRGLRLADNPLLPAAAGAGEGEAGEAAAGERSSRSGGAAVVEFGKCTFRSAALLGWPAVVQLVFCRSQCACMVLGWVHLFSCCRHLLCWHACRMKLTAIGKCMFGAHLYANLLSPATALRHTVLCAFSLQMARALLLPQAVLSPTLRWLPCWPRLRARLGHRRARRHCRSGWGSWTCC